MTSFRCVLPALLAVLASAQAAHAQDIGTCLAQLRGEALSKGIRAQTFDTALAGVVADPGVLEAMDNQPEFKIPVWDYLAVLVDAQRIEEGRARLAEWAQVLAQAEERFGVDRHTLVALWGVESDYGRQAGTRSLVRSLATVSCLGRRQAYFRGEFMATLRILQSGDMPAAALTGSWAGAFGQTQFMPSTYERVAVDFDGDGRRDIVASVPDALGSSANYLSRAGWKRGTPWGYEVRLPEGYRGPSGRRTRNALEEWRRLGMRLADGRALAGEGTAALLLPAGRNGPAFLVSTNFNAIYAYNASESYALAIAHLSDRLRGGDAFVTAWPTDDPGLSRAERREVQERLITRGHEIGAADGAIGPRTRQAIEAFQAASGLAVNGRAGQKLLRALRQP
jgi:lytic murein transglycosylase